MPTHPLFYFGLGCAVILAALIASAVTGWPHESGPEVTIISLN